MQVLQKAVVGTQLIEYENIIRSQNKIKTVTSQSEIIIRNQENENPIAEFENTNTSQTNQNNIEIITSQHQNKDSPDSCFNKKELTLDTTKNLNRGNKDLIFIKEARENKKTEVNNNENVKPENQLNSKKSTKFVKRIQVQVSTQSSSFSDSDENIEANRDDNLEKPKIFQKTRPTKVSTITESEKKGKIKKGKNNTDESDDEIKANSEKKE
ncbi:unnamed protein product [Parnassius mnemosyne]|uniref:Uncharacterized protein n=1 Tax=Parnassius mnemosyne TaxID=213953 RepID=A0AAV1LSM9_9NEOP